MKYAEGGATWGWNQLDALLTRLARLTPIARS